jgi:hypothetical protein
MRRRRFRRRKTEGKIKFDYSLSSKELLRGNFACWEQREREGEKEKERD